MKYGSRAAGCVGVIAVMLSAAAGNAASVDQPWLVAARESLAREFPEARLFELDGRVSRVYGAPVSWGASPVDSAGAFLSQYAAVLGARADDLALKPVGPGEASTVELMPRDDGSMKFTMVAYGQSRDGVPVFEGELRALVRNDPGFPLVLVSNATFDLGEFRVDAATAANPNVDAAFKAAEVRLPTTNAAFYDQLELVIYAGTRAKPLAATLALSFVAKTAPSPTTPEFGAWRVIADAATGEVLSAESMICNADVTGRVMGNATDGIKSAECNPEGLRPLKDLLVSSGGSTAYTNAAGGYSLDVSNGPATVSASPRGRHFRVFSPSTDAPNVTVQSGAPGVAPDLVLNAENTSEVRRAEVNAYANHVIVRDAILAASPNYPVIAGQTEWRVNVSVAGTCNAFYFPNDSTNFFNAGDGCPNTAFYDVCHHEYGHHLVQSGGSGQDQYGEGMADVMGVLISDQPVLGWGFFGNCNAGLRDSRTFKAYPCNGEAHDCGMLISGCVWDTREAMVAGSVPNYLTTLWRLAVNAVPLHAGQSNIAPDITIDWMTLDDDDSNLGNGTPNYQYIQAGFSRHNMGGPALDFARFVFQDAMPLTILPNTPTNLRLTVEPIAGVPTDGDAALIWKIDGGAENRTTLTRVGPNQYIATLPATPCLSTLSWAFTAGTSGGPLRSPTGTAFYSALSTSSNSVVFSEDFTSRNWNTSEEIPANSGGWERGIPVASASAPPTDFGGDGYCYVTDNVAGQDIDAQSVRLFSPSLDARGDVVHVRYARWFDNNAGQTRTADIFKVEVNGRGGAGTWTTLETVGPTGPDAVGGWIEKEFNLPASVRTNQFVIRFTVNDTGADATVEAGVDSVKLISFGCQTCAADFNNDGFLDFFDYGDYVSCFEGAACPSGRTADFNGDGFADFFDYADFVTAFEAGC